MRRALAFVISNRKFLWHMGEEIAGWLWTLHAKNLALQIYGIGMQCVKGPLNSVPNQLVKKYCTLFVEEVPNVGMVYLVGLAEKVVKIFFNTIIFYCIFWCLFAV